MVSSAVNCNFSCAEEQVKKKTKGKREVNQVGRHLQSRHLVKMSVCIFQIHMEHYDQCQSFIM